MCVWKLILPQFDWSVEETDAKRRILYMNVCVYVCVFIDAFSPRPFLLLNTVCLLYTRSAIWFLKLSNLVMVTTR